jgi:hypothetical protein
MLELCFILKWNNNPVDSASKSGFLVDPVRLAAIHFQIWIQPIEMASDTGHVGSGFS